MISLSADRTFTAISLRQQLISNAPPSHNRLEGVMEKLKSPWFKQQKWKALAQPWRLSYADSVLSTGAITTGNSKITAEHVVGTKKAIETTQKKHQEQSFKP